MVFSDYIVYGEYFSIWFRSIHEIFSQELDVVREFLFEGASINVSSCLPNYGFSLDISLPQIPLISNIINKIGSAGFTLLFADNNLLGMPFYFNFIVLFIRITVFIFILDLFSKFKTYVS